jgi:hypothetical protein
MEKLWKLKKTATEQSHDLARPDSAHTRLDEIKNCRTDHESKGVNMNEVTHLLASLTCFLMTAPASIAHDIFPSPNDPSFKMEKLASELAAAMDNATASGVSSTVVAAAPTVYSAAFLWKKLDLTGCFWNGSADLQKAVIESDRVWEGFSALQVSFVDENGTIRICANTSSADIRVSLDGTDRREILDYDPNLRPAGGFWSLTGAEPTFYKPKPPGATANLPIIGKYRGDGSGYFDFYVRHELGHARGLMHEHQRIECKGWFNLEQIIKDTHWPPEYASQAVDVYDGLNQIKSYDRPNYIGTYDISSIMQYNFNPGWYLRTRGKKNPCQRDFDVTTPSQGDKSTLVAMYGGPLPGAGPQPLIALNEAIANFDKLATIERLRFAFTEKTAPAAALDIVPENPRLSKGELAVLRKKMETDLVMSQKRVASSTKQAKMALDRLEQVLTRIKQFPNQQ